MSEICCDCIFVILLKLYKVLFLVNAVFKNLNHNFSTNKKEHQN